MEPQVSQQAKSQHAASPSVTHGSASRTMRRVCTRLTRTEALRTCSDRELPVKMCRQSMNSQSLDCENRSHMHCDQIHENSSARTLSAGAAPDVPQRALRGEAARQSGVARSMAKGGGIAKTKPTTKYIFWAITWGGPVTATGWSIDAIVVRHSSHVSSGGSTH